MNLTASRADVWAELTTTARGALETVLRGDSIAAGLGRSALILAALTLLVLVIPTRPHDDDPILTETDRTTTPKGM